MTSMLHRDFNFKLPRAAYGGGVYVIDDSGNKYIDACSGAAV